MWTMTQKKPRSSDELDILKIQQDDHLARRTLTAADVADISANSEDPHKPVDGTVGKLIAMLCRRPSWLRSIAVHN